MTDTYYLKLLVTEPVEDVNIFGVTRSFFDFYDSNPDLLNGFLPDGGKWEKVYLFHNRDGIVEKRVPSERPFSTKI